MGPGNRNFGNPVVIPRPLDYADKRVTVIVSNNLDKEAEVDLFNDEFKMDGITFETGEGLGFSYNKLLRLIQRNGIYVGRIALNVSPIMKNPTMLDLSLRCISSNFSQAMSPIPLLKEGIPNDNNQSEEFFTSIDIGVMLSDTAWLKMQIPAQSTIKVRLECNLSIMNGQWATNECPYMLDISNSSGEKKMVNIFDTSLIMPKGTPIEKVVDKELVMPEGINIESATHFVSYKDQLYQHIRHPFFISRIVGSVIRPLTDSEIGVVINEFGIYLNGERCKKSISNYLMYYDLPDMLSEFQVLVPPGSVIRLMCYHK